MEEDRPPKCIWEWRLGGRRDRGRSKVSWSRYERKTVTGRRLDVVDIRKPYNIITFPDVRTQRCFIGDYA